MNPKTQTTMTAESITSLFEDAIRNKVWITGPGALTNVQDAAKKCSEIHKNELTSKTEALVLENKKLQKDIGEWKLLHRQKCDQVQNCENAYMRLEERNITLQSSANEMEKALEAYNYWQIIKQQYGKGSSEEHKASHDFQKKVKLSLATYHKLKTNQK